MLKALLFVLINQQAVAIAGAMTAMIGALSVSHRLFALSSLRHRQKLVDTLRHRQKLVDNQKLVDTVAIAGAMTAMIGTPPPSCCLSGTGFFPPSLFLEIQTKFG